MTWPYLEAVHLSSSWAQCTIRVGAHIQLPEPVQVRAVLLDVREATFEYDESGQLQRAHVSGFRVTARGGRAVRVHGDGWHRLQFAGAPEWLIALGERMRLDVTVQLSEGTRWLGDKEPS